MSSKKHHSLASTVSTLLAAVTGVVAGATAVFLSNPKNRQVVSKDAKQGLKKISSLKKKFK